MGFGVLMGRFGGIIAPQIVLLVRTINILYCYYNTRVITKMVNQISYKLPLYQTYVIENDSSLYLQL